MQVTTKDRILAVVVDHIKKGVHIDTLSLSTIAKEADIGKSTVYEHFDSKQKLIQETYDYLFEYYEAIILKDLTAHTFKETFIEQLTRLLGVMKDAKIIMNAIMHNEREIFPPFNRETESLMRGMQKKINQRFLHIMQMGASEKHMDPSHIQPHTGHVMKAIISGLLYQYVNGEMDMNESELYELIYQQVTRLL